MHFRPFRLLLLGLSTGLHSAPTTSDCGSLKDTKLLTTPVLYLPAGEKIPATLRAIQQKCRVEVRNLPLRIKHLGDVSPAQLPAPGLLYLPYPYVAPGGQFNEMYGWDSYFILLGELADNRIDLARNAIDNFFYELD